nr:MAG TPA: hypothetical protein [Caudoviricetes sp.]
MDSPDSLGLQSRPVRTAYRTRSAHSRQSGHTPMWQASQSRAYVMR